MGKLFRDWVKATLLVAISLSLFASFAAAEEGQMEGERVFNQLCKGCHRLTGQMLTGPGLYGVTRRRTEEWIDKWLSGPREVIASNDPIAAELKAKFKITMPTLMPLKDSAVRKAVIEFLKANDSK